MSERYKRQNYLDIPIGQVNQETHPICQLKYDGIWCMAEVDQQRVCRYYSRNGELKLTGIVPQTTEPGCYVGELMYGSEWSKENDRHGKFYMFDFVEHRSTELKSLTYGERYTRLGDFHRSGMLPKNWHLIQTFPTHQSLDIWRLMVESGDFEGIVFRHPNQVWSDTLLRAKHQITRDLYITGFKEGEKGLAGTLGAVTASYSPLGIGVELTIGGGFTLKLRRDIWQNQDKFLGRCFTVTAKKEFKSGLLRHPNFLEWHADKPPAPISPQ